jgi:3-hydroxybutyrate dehydrogenase
LSHLSAQKARGFEENAMLNGKSAIVTGSTSGIGLGVARALAANGANVLLNGFGKRAEIDKLCDSLRSQHGVRVGYNAGDISKPEEVAGLVKQAAHELGSVDILINNAGIQHTAPVQEFPVERWDAIIAVNLSAAFHSVRLALPQMLDRNWGRIVNTASTHGLVASVHKAAYVAASTAFWGSPRWLRLRRLRRGSGVMPFAPAGS